MSERNRREIKIISSLDMKNERLIEKMISTLIDKLTNNCTISFKFKLVGEDEFEAEGKLICE